jgi:hypothetical protein
LKQTPNAWVPVHKYISRSGLDRDSTHKSVKAAASRIPSGIYRVPPESYELTLDELVDEFGLTKALNLICSFDRSKVSAASLRTLLVEHLGELEGGDANLGTSFGKAACLYDLLEFGAPPATTTTATPSPSARGAAVGVPPQKSKGKGKGKARAKQQR